MMLLSTDKKVSLQNFEPTFPVIFQIFDLEENSQTALKVRLSC